MDYLTRTLIEFDDTLYGQEMKYHSWKMFKVILDKKRLRKQNILSKIAIGDFTKRHLQ